MSYPVTLSSLTRIVKTLSHATETPTQDANPIPSLRVVNVFLKTVNKSSVCFFGRLTGVEVGDSGNGVREHAGIYLHYRLLVLDDILRIMLCKHLPPC